MIFDESAVCTPVFCREVTGETPGLPPAAPFTVVLASSGRGRFRGQRARASGGGRAVPLREAWLLEVTPVTGCHVLAAGFSGTAAGRQPRACPPRLASDCSACPMAAQLLGGAAMNAAALSRCGYHILCELAAADAAVPGFRRWWRMRCWPSARITQACTAWRS